MNIRNYAMLGTVALLAAGGAIVLSAGDAGAQSSEAEELTRGPVHEAFAGSVSFNPEPGIILKSQPPRAIDEVPPDQKPAGDNVAWIPGYWGWDEESNDFLWISGIWRNLPPDRQWVPGYWAGLDDSQWQWTSGYWADERAQEVAYYEKPPKSIETGPNVESPGDNHVWISGNWIYREDRYAWRPGYWEPARENWVWVPAHYQWTPRGYVFVDGYWDYDVGRRGVVFAPVRFHREVYDRPDYHYTPATVIVANIFLKHLFVRPSYGHYYFGDYYAPRYRNEGFVAPFVYQSERRGYDPIYVHDRWRNRGDRDWDRRRREQFDFYRDHEDARPPRTLAALLARPDRDRRGDRRDDFDFAQPLDRLAASRDNGGLRFQALERRDRDRIVEQRQEMRKFRDSRAEMERRRDDRPGDRGDERRSSIVERLTKSPVVAKRADQLSGNDAPPKRLEAREPDRRGDRRDAPGQAGRDGMPPGPDDRNRDGMPEQARRDGESPRPGADRDGNRARPDGAPGRREGAPDQARREEASPARNPERRDDPATATRDRMAPGERERREGGPPDQARRDDMPPGRAQARENNPPTPGQAQRNRAEPSPDRNRERPSAPETAKRPEAKPEPPERKVAPPEVTRRPEPPRPQAEQRRETPRGNPGGPSAPARRTPQMERQAEPQPRPQAPQRPEAPRPQAQQQRRDAPARPQQAEQSRRPEPRAERPVPQQKAPQPQKAQKAERGAPGGRGERGRD